MAYLDYYRSNPNWATSQWQSTAPPAPPFQPQPSWGGLDFYRATAGQNFDGGIYNYASNRLQGLGPQGLSAMGPSLLEAKILHRRAYGGLGDLLTMTPNEIGAAAAYEVWRNWRHNYGVLGQPLSGDTMRQREALVGLAIGEATKLWQYTTRVADSGGRYAAVEAAAIAAARIFDEGNELLMRGGGAYGGGMGGMNMGALSPAIPTNAMGGSAMGAMGAPGMGMSTGMGTGMGMGGGLGGMGGMGGLGSIAGTAASPVPSVAPPLMRRRSLSFGAAPGGYGYGDSAQMAGVPTYAGSNAGSAMGGYAMSNGMLTSGASMGVQRPPSAGGIQYGAPEEYGPGGFGETAIARHERHKAERAAARAERAALKEARYRDRMGGNYGPSRAYDDNYPYEYGRRGYGGGHGDGYDDYGYDDGYGGDPRGSSYGGRRRRGSMYEDPYGDGGRRY